MDINEMTKEQFLELPLLDDFTNYDIDSIVLIPTNPHDSGFRNFIVVGVNNWEPIGKCRNYDTFSLMLYNTTFTRVGIDCLKKSKLMRIFLPQNAYKLDSMLHTIRNKGEING